MPQRINRLRIHPAAIIAILLVLGGSIVAAFLTSSGEGGTLLADLPLEATEIFEGVDEVIRTRLVGDSTSIAHLKSEQVVLHPNVSPFYAARMYAPAWPDSTARDTLLSQLQALADVGLNPDDYYVTSLSRERGSMSADSIDSLADIDLLLTDAVFKVADDLSGPRVNVDSLYGSNWFASSRSLRADTLLSMALASENPVEQVARVIDQLQPQHPDYRALRAMVAHQRALVERPDWPNILPGREIAPGDTSALVPVLRERIRLEGVSLDHPANAAERFYDAELASAVRAFQAGQNLEPDGVINQPTREALNKRPIGEIIPLLTLNLERWRWLPDDLGDLHVLANIPAFQLMVRERNGEQHAEIFRMNTVVGKRSWETPVFSDTMTQIVFSPTWTIPASIQMESYGRVRPGGMVRDPGPGNPMGRVKFLFPNDHAIYIHDTPSRWAFSQDFRAYSHGCLRAHEPQRLAEELLTRSNEWTVEDVAAKFDGPWRLQVVELDRPIPVHLVYFTAWVDESGQLQTYADVYGHDAKLAAALGIELPPRS